MKIPIMKPKIFIKICSLLLSLVVLTSCEKEISTAVPDEPVKEITGKWKIVSLFRNGEDLTERMDLTKFRINFNPDGTYTLEDRFAFIVSGPGSFRLSDPQYPFSLILTPQGAEQTMVDFQFPVVAGKRQMSLNMSLGCSSNTYQFNFEREN